MLFRILPFNNEYALCTNLLTHALRLCVLIMSFSRIVRSFERISENLVDQENFTNTTIQGESLVFRGERVS